MFKDMKGGRELQHCYHISDFEQWHNQLVDVSVSSIHECFSLLNKLLIPCSISTSLFKVIYVHIQIDKSWQC